MDSLKTLMDKKAYDLVLKITENSTDAISLFYRISALLALAKVEDALNVIKSKRTILEEKPSILIKIHIEILCMLGRFDEAYEELGYYQELPYESQETEELLRSMPNFIRQEEKKSYRHGLTEDEVIKKLLSKNDEDVVAGINQVRAFSLDSFLLPLFKILRSYPRQAIRVCALLLLVEKKYDKEVEFLHFDKLIKVVPSSLEEPFAVNGFNNLEEISFAFQSEFHDPSVAENALQILSTYLLYIYPNKIDLSKDEIIVVFGYLAAKFLQSNDVSLTILCKNKNLDVEKLLDKVSFIEETLASF